MNSNMTLAATFNQENLIEIDRENYIFKLKNYFDHHRYLAIAYKNVCEKRDNKGHYRKVGDTYLSVCHYVHKEEGGLKLVYKVDKEIWEHLNSL